MEINTVKDARKATLDTCLANLTTTQKVLYEALKNKIIDCCNKGQSSYNLTLDEMLGTSSFDLSTVLKIFKLQGFIIDLGIEKDKVESRFSTFKICWN